MGKSRGRANDRRLANMATDLPVQRYVPPDGNPSRIRETVSYELLPGHRFVERQEIWRGMVVDFSISQMILEGGAWHEVARIDCCGGFVHRHQFDQAGVDIYDHRPIVDIPSTNGHLVVHDAYTRVVDLMHDEYGDNVRRWRNGS